MTNSISKALGGLGLVLPIVAIAGGTPEMTDVTPENAASYGIEVVEESAGSHDERSFRIRFPSQIQGDCSLGRIQTAVFDASGNQTSTSSIDVSDAESSGSVLVGYRDARHSMSVGLQYCCKTPDFACEIMLSIESLDAFSHNKSLKYAPALSGLHRTRQRRAA